MADNIEVYASTIEEVLDIMEKTEAMIARLQSTFKTKKPEHVEKMLGILQQRMLEAIGILEDELHEGYMLNEFNHFNPYPEDIQNLLQQQYQQG